MSSGYTPLFASLTTGTLCGKWPDIGLWPIVLSLADRNGVVDVTPAYIAQVTGLPLPDVVACMERFCAPDPYSRSTDGGGARLVLIDPAARPWGWRVVNHARYRERARKQSHDARRVEDGTNARRLAERRSDPTRPDATRADPLSNKTKTETRQEEEDARAGEFSEVPRETSDPNVERFRMLERIRAAFPPGAYRLSAWQLAEKHIARLLDDGAATADDLIAAAAAYRVQQDALQSTGGRWVLSPATFYAPDPGHWRGPFTLTPAAAAPRRAPLGDRLDRITTDASL